MKQEKAVFTKMYSNREAKWFQNWNQHGYITWEKCLSDFPALCAPGTLCFYRGLSISTHLPPRFSLSALLAFVQSKLSGSETIRGLTRAKVIAGQVFSNGDGIRNLSETDRLLLPHRCPMAPAFTWVYVLMVRACGGLCGYFDSFRLVGEDWQGGLESIFFKENLNVTLWLILYWMFLINEDLSYVLYCLFLTINLKGIIF